MIFLPSKIKHLHDFPLKIKALIKFDIKIQSNLFLFRNMFFNFYMIITLSDNKAELSQNYLSSSSLFIGKINISKFLRTKIKHTEKQQNGSWLLQYSTAKIFLYVY